MYTFIFSKRTTIPFFLVFFVSACALNNPQETTPVSKSLTESLPVFIWSDKNNEETSGATLSLLIRAGSLQEQDDELGYAHFVEHMAFNGTRDYPKGELMQRLNKLGLSIGRHSNATTRFNSTLYTIKLDVVDGQEAPAIENLSLELRRGQRLCLLGESGAGKSTVLRLLTCNYSDYEGEILFDNRDIRNLSLQSVRSQFSNVLQKNILFSGTLESNILYASKRQDKPWLKHTAQLACANKFIEALPDGYQSTVNEQGSNFSGGQVQRIALARALAAQTPLLILDEATSALDAETEYTLVENLRRLGRKKTLVIATHRLSLARMCDQIIVMKKGKVVEQGSHRLLMQRKGEYYKLQQLQAGIWFGDEVCV